VDEHIVAAIFALDEAEALLGVEELHLALGFADHLGGHAAKAAAATTAAAAARAAAEAAATTAAEAAAVPAAKATTAAAEAATVTIGRRRRKSVEIILAKSVAFIPASAAAPTPVKTHAELFTFNVVLDHSLKNRADVNPITQIQASIPANLSDSLPAAANTAQFFKTPQPKSMEAGDFSTVSPAFPDQKPVEDRISCLAQQDKPAKRHALPSDSLKPNSDAWRTINGRDRGFAARPKRLSHSDDRHR
jgi:Flp pilus assembly protein TadG